MSHPTSTAAPDSLVLRSLKVEDYNKGFVELLSQLTTVDEISHEMFKKRFNEIQSSGNTFVQVIEDVAENRIIGSATLLVEKKFVHGCGAVGHVEDVVVSDAYRGKNLGRRLIEDLQRIGVEQGCYKVILDCAEHNVPFYGKMGFKRKEVQMAWYVDTPAASTTNLHSRH
eukprot:GILJ01006463.1.p1 GENE.GILJ01006463.1~~GILJ01006463.1.p1  ORF type:complete len:170 (+),score=23.43 GILJ01006463.1:162-671(+)